MRARLPLVVLLTVLAGVAAGAHVTIAPADGRLGLNERYTVRVPTEGQVATVGLDLEVPPGVTVTGVLAMPGWTADVRREEKRIVGISWKTEIPPGQFGELVFTARNPKEGTEIVWNVKQRFADGTSRDWTPKTRLVSAP